MIFLNLVDRGLVRILDLGFLRKDVEGSVSALDLAELTDPAFAASRRRPPRRTDRAVAAGRSQGARRSDRPGVRRADAAHSRPVSGGMP